MDRIQERTLILQEERLDPETVLEISRKLNQAKTSNSKKLQNFLDSSKFEGIESFTPQKSIPQQADYVEILYKARTKRTGLFNIDSEYRAGTRFGMGKDL